MFARFKFNPRTNLSWTFRSTPAPSLPRFVRSIDSPSLEAQGTTRHEVYEMEAGGRSKPILSPTTSRLAQVSFSFVVSDASSEGSSRLSGWAGVPPFGWGRSFARNAVKRGPAPDPSAPDITVG